VADSTKWPITNLDYVATFPKQIKEVFEEFTQMYEKSKLASPQKQQKLKVRTRSRERSS